jgi:hypothetical protein
VPIVIVILYAFNAARDQTWPITRWTTEWFGVALDNSDLHDACVLSVEAALGATVVALLLGTLASLAVHRFTFFGRDTVSFMLVLPIALPGIVTGMALNATFNSFHVPFSLWTIIVGHATFCVVTVYNNTIARMRRSSRSIEEASMDLGATPWQTFRLHGRHAADDPAVDLQQPQAAEPALGRERGGRVPDHPLAAAGLPRPAPDQRGRPPGGPRLRTGRHQRRPCMGFAGPASVAGARDTQPVAGTAAGRAAVEARGPRSRSAVPVGAPARRSVEPFGLPAPRPAEADAMETRMSEPIRAARTRRRGDRMRRFLRGRRAGGERAPRPDDPAGGLSRAYHIPCGFQSGER